jgi:long-chain acyl-CoA synthetase
VIIPDLVAAAAAAHGRRPALTDLEGSTRTWAEVDEAVSAVAGGLAGLGIGVGDRVAIVLPNGLDFPVAFWGVLRAGAAVVPVNPGYTPPEVAHLLADSGARAVIVDPRLVSLADQACARLPDDTAPARTTVAALTGAGAVAPASAADPHRTAVVCYTSGTTGRPKGAMLTHANLLANLAAFSDLDALRLRPDDVLLGLLPFFHIFGLNVILNAAARAGASVLTMDRFSPTGSLAALAAHRVTVAYGAPPVYAAWCAVPIEQVPPLPALRAAVSGADALPVPVFQAFKDRYGIAIMEGYGLTETAPVLASNAAAPAVRPGTVGVALPGVEVRVVDADGAQQPAGTVGEIQARGPNVFTGYHGQPDATAEVLGADGWFATGDLGRLEDDGYLQIAGRLKDLVIVSGFNVYPREVEQALLEHPDVADVAVVGLPDTRTGERVRAVVVARPGATLDADAVLAHCRTRLARYKLPREVLVVDAIPRLPTGKVHRDALRR